MSTIADRRLAEKDRRRNGAIGRAVRAAGDLTET
jgi:hypothetical protein